MVNDLALCIVGSYRPGEQPLLSEQLETMQRLRLAALSAG
jgi:hypothetical protein